MKEICLVAAYTPDLERQNVLRELVYDLKNNDKKVLLVTHSETPQDILKMVDYHFYDSENEFLTDNKYKVWYASQMNSEITVVSQDVIKYSAAVLPCTRNLWLGLSIAKSLGYDCAHYIEYDSKIIDISIIDENTKLLEEFDGVYYTDDATWQIRLPEQQSGGTHLYGAYSVYNLNSYSFDDLKWDRDLILDEYTKSENSQLVERVTEKLLIKGKKFVVKDKNILLEAGLKPNLLKELVSINLGKALQKGSEENIYLQREDELYINSIVDLRDSLTVDLLGEVRSQGRFNYVDSMTVKDLILMAGGFNYAANKQIEVARLIQYGERVTDNQVAIILKTEVNGDLSFNAGQVNFVLQPMDVVTITKKVGFTNPEVVSISGQVQNVGKYTLSTRVERVSEIVKRAGGLIGEAYGEGAYIKRSRYNIDTLKADESKTSIEEAYNRKFKAQQEQEKQNLATILNSSSANGMENQNSLDAQNQKKKNLKDTLDLLFKELNEDTYQIAIDINKIIEKPGSEFDLVLRDKDEIIIPKTDNRVKISGGVLRPTNIVYREGLTVGECISAAGGISEYAKRGRAYVIYANGKSNRTKMFGIFRVNPPIRPGSEVVIPETDAKKEKAITTIVQFTTVIAQVIAALATISLLQK